MSAVATMQRAMDTLFDPDEVGGQALVGPPRATPEEHGRETAGGARAGLVDSAGGGQAGLADSIGARFGTRGGGPMLDDIVAGVWEGLAAHGVVECPVCSSEMRPEYGVHARPIGGRCGGCGSTLN